MPMTCIILATLHDDHFSEYNNPSALIPLLGIPLVERTLRTAMSAGLTTFQIVTREKDQKVRPYLDHFASKHNINITHTISDLPDKKAGNELLLVEHGDNKPFLLLSIDYLFTANTIKKLLKTKLQQDEMGIAIDSDTIHKKLDLIGITRAHTVKNRIRALNPGLKEFDSFDTGVYLCQASFLKQLEKHSKTHKNTEIIDATHHLIKEDKVVGIDIGDNFWSHVDSGDAIDRTEQEVIKNLKTQDTDRPVMKHIVKPFSCLLTRALMHAPLNIKQLSIFIPIIAMLAAYFFSFSHYAGLFFGGLLAIICGLLHISVKEMAELKYERTPFFDWFNTITGKYTELLLLVGLILHVANAYSSSNVLLIGILALMGTMLFHFSYDQFYQITQKRPPQGQDMQIKSEVRFLLIIIGALVNLPLFTLLVFGILLNAIVIRRLFVWKTAANKA